MYGSQAALSQVENLLFLAKRETVLVYKPTFPEQDLGNPLLAIVTPPSRPGLRGHINGRKPHEINHLIVADMGLEEIVVCACDDGDVYAYYLQSILRALEDRAEGREESPKAFFHQNVGASAWGLTVHKESRSIAASSNSRNITVFSFGIDLCRFSASTSTRSEPMTTVLNDMEGPRTNAESSPLSYMEKDFTSTLSHEDYLRNYRNKDRQLSLNGHKTNIPSISFLQAEVSGRWLVSTDLNGLIALWDVLTRQVVRLGTFRGPEGAAPEAHHGHDNTMIGWSVSCLDSRAFRPTLSSQETFGYQCFARDHQRVQDISGSSSLVRDSGGYVPHPLLTELEKNNKWRPIQPKLIADGLYSFTTPGQDGHDDVWPVVPDPELSWKTVSPNSFVILHTSAKTIHLLVGTESHFREVVRLRSPLCPWQFAPDPQALDPWDRLNMMTKIEELGIVAVASNAGRVALLTLTMLLHTEGPEFGFRLEFTLPLAHQEWFIARHVRNVPLVGLASAPMQGREISVQENWRCVESTRRYRILLLYQNGTTLSYEVNRNETGLKVGWPLFL